MDHIFTHPSADGHLSCIHANVNSALVNKGAPGSPPKASPPQSYTLPGGALQLPAAVHSGGLVSLSRVCGAKAQILWVSLHSDCQGSTASLSESLKVFPSIPTNCPPGGNLALLQPPTLWVRGPVSLLLLLFLPLFILPLLHGSIYSFQRRQWHPLQYSCLENPMDGGAW